jgi:hypothetical protein
MSMAEIYESLRERGLASSLRHFSRVFLNRAENYVSDRGLGRCSADALLNLHRTLGETGQADLQASVRAWLLDGPPSALTGGRP